MPQGTQPNLRRQRRLLLREIERSRAEKRMDENGTASTDYYGHGPLASSLLFSHTALAAWMASHNGTRPARATEGEAAGQPAGNNSKPHTACPNGPLCPLCPPGEFEVKMIRMGDTKPNTYTKEITWGAHAHVGASRAQFSIVEEPAARLAGHETQLMRKIGPTTCSCDQIWVNRNCWWVDHAALFFES